MLSGLSQHGYTILFAIVFLESIGLPIPAALALLIAGGASARGSLYLPLAAGSALLALIIGDTLMFLHGPLHRMVAAGTAVPPFAQSRNRASCARRIPSIGAAARCWCSPSSCPGLIPWLPPLAGSMNMRFVQFFGLDFTGASLYVSCVPVGRLSL